ncbi:hypothetical protein ACWEDZ_39210 [Streptomyces sp. NPDC005047]
MSESVAALFEGLLGAEPPDDASVLFDTVCVMGGSIAGPIAARVLSDRAGRVVIVEPDDVSAGVGTRPGVTRTSRHRMPVPIGPEPVRGGEAVAAFHRTRFVTFLNSRHYWRSTETLTSSPSCAMSSPLSIREMHSHECQRFR